MPYYRHKQTDVRACRRNKQIYKKIENAQARVRGVDKILEPRRANLFNAVRNLPFSNARAMLPAVVADSFRVGIKFFRIYVALAFGHENYPPQYMAAKKIAPVICLILNFFAKPAPKHCGLGAGFRFPPQYAATKPKTALF